MSHQGKSRSTENNVSNNSNLLNSNDSNSSTSAEPCSTESSGSNSDSKNATSISNESTNTSSEVGKTLENNILVDPNLPDLAKVCIYCKLDDNFTFSGKFLNCEKHGGKLTTQKNNPCFHCIVESNGNCYNFKVCSLHAEGAKDNYQVLKLRTMTKVLKVEDNEDNADLIRSVSSRLPPKTIGYSLGCDKKLTVVSYKISTPPNIPQEFYVSSREPVVRIEPLEVSLERFKESLKNKNKNTEEVSNNTNYDDNVDAVDGDGVANDDSYFHSRPRITDDSNPLFQDQGPGTLMLTDSGPVGTPRPMKIPDVFNTEALLDKGIHNIMDDKVCRGWMGALQWLLRKYKFPDSTEARNLQKAVVMLVKVNLNMYLYGSEFLVRLKEAGDHEDQAMTHDSQAKMIKHVEQSITTLLERNNKEIPEKLSSEIAKAIKDAHNDAKTDNLDDEMVESKEPKAIRVEHGVNDTFEIPFNDTYRKFNRYAINKMILWYDKNNSINVDEDGDEPMRKQAFHGRGGGRGGGRGKGRGGYHNNHNRRNRKRFST